MRTRSLVVARRLVSSTRGCTSSTSSSISVATSSTSMPSSVSARTAASRASGGRSARSSATMTSAMVTDPRSRPLAMRSVSWSAGVPPLATAVLVTTLRPTMPVCVTTSPLGGPNFVTPPLQPRSAVQQCLPAFLQPHQIPEHLVVTGLLSDRVHPLHPGLHSSDLPAGRELAHPGQHDVRVFHVRLPRDLQRLHRQPGHESLGSLVGRLLPQPRHPVPRAARARCPAAPRDQREHRAVDRRGKCLRAQRVELGPAQGRPLHGQLQGLPLHPHHGVILVIRRERPVVPVPISLRGLKASVLR